MAKRKRRAKAGATKPRATKPRPVPAKRKPPKKARPRPVKARGAGEAGSRPPVPRKVSKATPAVKRKGSKKKAEAARLKARARRAEARAIAEALAAERSERARKAARARWDKAKKRTPDERELAIGWLEGIRDRIAHVFPASLEVTEPEVGARAPWLVVGRFDAMEEIDYAQLALAFEELLADDLLVAQIHPERLSQIRVVYSDPNAIRGEGDSIVSKIGGWEFILGDIVNELVGGGPEDEGALAVRYEETTVPSFYVYFSSEIIRYTTGGGRTMQVKL